MTKHIHISAKEPIDLKLKELLQYRDLILLFTKKTFIVKYKQTILGPLWLFIKPLLTGLMYLLVFGNIANFGTDGTPKLLFYFSGTALWTYFSDCVTLNANIFITNANLFGKVYFPRLTLAVSYILSNLIRFFIQMLLTFAMMLWFAAKGMLCVQPWRFLFLIPLLLQIGILGAGTGLIISSLTTKYRDLNVLLEFGMSLWMYVTPIVYPLSQLEPGKLRDLVLLNPVSAPAEAFRLCLFGSGTLMPERLLLSALFTLAAALCGIVLFNRVERTFQDTI